MQRRYGTADERVPEYDGGDDGGSADRVEVFEGAAFYYEGDFGECVDICGGGDGGVCSYEGGGVLKCIWGLVKRERRMRLARRVGSWWAGRGWGRVAHRVVFARRGVGFGVVF